MNTINVINYASEASVLQNTFVKPLNHSVMYNLTPKICKQLKANIRHSKRDEETEPWAKTIK